MEKNTRYIIFALLLLQLTSCDSTMPIFINNYRGPCRVHVTYDTIERTRIDHDTLMVGTLIDKQPEGYVVRKNESRDSYWFIAPGNRQILLFPQSFGQPIRRIEIQRDVDSTLIIELRSKKEMLNLRKEGWITIKRSILKASIQINNR
jgi:hypothetical protein